MIRFSSPPTWTRTRNPRLKRSALYRLSYGRCVQYTTRRYFFYNGKSNANAPGPVTRMDRQRMNMRSAVLLEYARIDGMTNHTPTRTAPKTAPACAQYPSARESAATNSNVVSVYKKSEDALRARVYDESINKQAIATRIASAESGAKNNKVGNKLNMYI